MPDQEDQQARETLLRMMFGYMTSQAIYTMAMLGLADQLDGQARTTAELASASRSEVDSMRRLLRVLSSAGVVDETEPDRFELTPLGRPLRSTVPGSVGRLAKMYVTPAIWQAWGRLSVCVRTGEPSIRGGSDEVFEQLARSPRMSRIFNDAMAADTEAVAGALATDYDFSKFRTVVDIGGGNGTLLTTVLAATPGLSGILFDTATGVKDAAATVAAAGVTDRCEIVTGDFFESVPAGGDAYVMKSVIHDWDAERGIEILRSCRRAMAADARVLLVEMMLPGGTETADPVSAWSDLHMMVTTGGRERTEAEFAALLEAAGFTLTALTPPLAGTGYRVIEGTPA